MTDVVAVHGAFRGGWSWDRVRPLIEAGGHRLFAPDLTGMGSGPQPAVGVGQVTLSDWIADVVGVFDEHGITDAVLVGHSMGGVVCQAAAGMLAGRVRRLVLIDSPLIVAGQRAVDVSGPAPPPADLLPPRDTWLPPTPVGPAHGFRVAALADWVNERLCATPFGPQLDPCPAAPAGSTLGRPAAGGPVAGGSTLAERTPGGPVASGVVSTGHVVTGAVPTTIVFCDRTPAGYPSTFARARCDADGIEYTLLDRHHDVPLLDPAAVVGLLVDRPVSFAVSADGTSSSSS